MRKAETNEALTVLYLRLAGYFTTGLVVHSPDWGLNRTEIDCLAIRLPHHEQPDRGVKCPSFLALRDGETDLLICEVKSSAQALRFNERLYRDPEALPYVLRWAGVFPEDAAIARAADRLRPILQTGVSAALASEGALEAGVRVRGLLSCPPGMEAELPNAWCLWGSEILRFAHECFNPPERRTDCSTRYPFGQWGGWLAPIVDYIKDCDAQTQPTLEGLYEALDAH
jgi:hypothetical protein